MGLCLAVNFFLHQVPCDEVLLNNNTSLSKLLILFKFDRYKHILHDNLYTNKFICSYYSNHKYFHHILISLYDMIPNICF